MAIYRSSDAGDATNNVTINEVIDLKEQARISAESAEDDRAAIEAFLGGAEALGDAVEWAEEWAIKATDVPVSVDAGGDATTTFSAAHHAVKSAGSASAALASETAAGLSETAAEASEIAAGLSETEAASSAFDANASFVAADDAATEALASETAAGLSETAAASSATAAGLSETNALASETAAGLSETAAAASETAAGLSETAAGLSETAAAASETAAGASEIAAGLSETAAGVSETNALASEMAAGQLFDNFDARYLGAKTADPTLDNSGDALIEGALYFNSTVSEMRVYNGTAWESTAGLDKATTAQAEAGTDDAAYMTPLKTFQAIEETREQGVPVAAVEAFAQNTAPTGWLKANGSAVSRTTYSALFAAIGIVFGAGDGTTTFNLPDLRGEFPRGWDDARGVDTGRAFGSAQTHLLASHGHPFEFNRATSGGDGNGNYLAGVTGSVSLRTSASSGRTASLSVRPDGGTETRPRNIALLYCIKI